MNYELSDEKGQMTIELALFLPVALIVGMIVFNALLFFGQCAEFDRIARNAVRVCASSPTYGQTSSESVQQVLAQIEERFDDDNVECTVEMLSDSQGLNTYEATIGFHPTLFGMTVRDEVFGVRLPILTHKTKLTVDPYKPGMFF